MLRVKNESRWIKRVLDSILPLCDAVVVLDDKSDDDTPHICASMPRTDVFASPFADLREDRDKNYLFGKVMMRRPDWILAIDGDELLTPESIPLIRANLATQSRCMSFSVRYLWDRADQVRI